MEVTNGTHTYHYTVLQYQLCNTYYTTQYQLTLNTISLITLI